LEKYLIVTVHKYEKIKEKSKFICQIPLNSLNEFDLNQLFSPLFVLSRRINAGEISGSHLFRWRFLWEYQKE